jgi:hypothetical protein
LAVADFDAVDQQLDVLTTQLRIRVSQISIEKLAKGSDNGGSDPAVACFELTFEDSQIGFCAGSLSADIREFAGDLRVLRAADTGSDELDDSGAFTFKLCQFRSQPFQFDLAFGNGGLRSIQPSLQQKVQAVDGICQSGYPSDGYAGF